MGEGAWWRTPLARAKDPATWIDPVYHLLLMPIGVVTFTIVVTMWPLALGFLVTPRVGFVSPERPAGSLETSGSSSTERGSNATGQAKELVGG